MNYKGVKIMAIVNETALVYCENQFGLVDGKTASGLVRHSETYTVVGVIDSSLAGKDAGEELGEKKMVSHFCQFKGCVKQAFRRSRIVTYMERLR
jgi:uncharacterized NAD-dependent epimerase/dehydratase family protein